MFILICFMLISRNTVASCLDGQQHKMTRELLKVHGQEEKQGLQLKYPRDQRRVEEEELQVSEQCEAARLHAFHHTQITCQSCS
jgi:hypothetical protein